MSQLQRKTQFGVEGTIQPTMQITWGIYRRIPDAGGTWRKEVLGAYPDAHTAQSCLRMLLIGRGYDIDAANQRAASHADSTRAGHADNAQEQVDHQMILLCPMDRNLWARVMGTAIADQGEYGDAGAIIVKDRFKMIYEDGGWNDYCPLWASARRSGSDDPLFPD